MNFYKTFYKDGTWDILRTKKAIRSPKQVCNTCVKVCLISPWKYFWLWIQDFLINFQ